MLRIPGRSQRLCSGWSRRDLLQAGALGCLGLSLADVLRAAPGERVTADAEPRSFGRAKNCILLFLTGGPPQHDTWDPKPAAPVEVRGEFAPLSTSVPGIQVSEMFPLLAREIHRTTIVRSVTHEDTAHTTAGYAMLTGAAHDTPNVAGMAQIGPSPKDRPHLGSLVSRLAAPRNGLPPFVALPEIIRDAGVNTFPGLGGGFLGQRHDPFRIDANADRTALVAPAVGLSEEVPAARLARRRELLAQLDRRLPLRVPERDFAEVDAFHARAFDMIHSPAAAAALDLAREPRGLRERYGEHLFGKGCLLARRLIEAGVRLAAVYWHYEGPDDSPVWDTHGNNFPHLRQRLIPPTDRALSALLADLAERGLLDETLVICMGEFGRSPRINAQAGRDHWPKVQSLLLGGAGIPGGSVYGASDKLGGEPARNALRPSDLFATFMHLLGLGPETMLTNLDGQPVRATSGKPIQALL